MNPYDFTYGDPSKCTIKTNTPAKIIEIKGEIIAELLEKEPEFKLKWFKSIFLYSVRHKKSMEHLEKQFTEKELRRFVEFSEMKIMKQGDVDLLPNGGYLF